MHLATGSGIITTPRVSMVPPLGLGTLPLHTKVGFLSEKTGKEKALKELSAMVGRV